MIIYAKERESVALSATSWSSLVTIGRGNSSGGNSPIALRSPLTSTIHSAAYSPQLFNKAMKFEPKDCQRESRTANEFGSQGICKLQRARIRASMLRSC